MIVRKFTELESWKLARILVRDIYYVSINTDLKKDYGLKDQLQLAAVSIMSNIAEGFDSMNRKSIIHIKNLLIKFIKSIEKNTNTPGT